jgi:hypothetical protein
LGGSGRTNGSSVKYSLAHAFLQAFTTSWVITPLILLNPESSESSSASETIDYEVIYFRISWICPQQVTQW